MNARRHPRWRWNPFRSSRITSEPAADRRPRKRWNLFLTIGLLATLAAFCVEAFIGACAVSTLQAAISRASNTEELRNAIDQTTQKFERGQNVELIGLWCVALPLVIIGGIKRRREERERLGNR